MRNAIFTVALLALATITTVGAQVGRTSHLGVVDPQPNFNIDPSHRAVVSPDGRSVFLSSNGPTAAERQIISARVGPGTAQVISRINTDPSNICELAVSPNGLRLVAVETTGVRFYDINPLTGALTANGVTTLPADVSLSRPVIDPAGTWAYIGSSVDNRIFVCSYGFTGGPTSTATATSNPSAQFHRLAINDAGALLLAAAMDPSGNDELIAYSAGGGSLTELGHYDLSSDLGWTSDHNPVLDGAGAAAYVVNAVSNEIHSIDLGVLS
ncbi:MAG: hypothetical protein GY842_02970, partial [bacterium]|nr:hypothetical protein [bacterium]